MSTLTTVSNLIVMSAIGTTVTAQSLDIDANNSYTIHNYGHYKALEESQYNFETSENSVDDTEMYSILNDVASKMVASSTNIDPEFVEIVNEHFWDLI